MEISTERINVIYTESSKLRVYINLIKDDLKLLQEVSLNTAINASKENSVVFADIYKMIANQIRKNTVDMLLESENMNSVVNELVKYSLSGVKKNSYNLKITMGKKLIKDDRFGNLIIVNRALENNMQKLVVISKQLAVEIENVKRLHETLVNLNKKIWLTTTNLKVENNIKESNKEFFDSIAEILDKKNEFMTKKLEDMGKDIMKIERLIKADSN
ncbi:MAG: hypothetical protein HQK50_01270 [Oligoflexia bacterium]|nr:hypothetical protein [Oligoflexia bacterium]MBF0364168.1 hypothetical protein [Oligoflexia bacterium]